MSFKAIKNHIVFQFIDEIDSKGQFVETTKWGFTIPGHFDNSAKSPRWCTVTHAGPECKTVKVGQQVLVNALKWTPGFRHLGERFWRTDDTQVAAVRTNKTSKLRALRDTVLFIRHEDPVNEAKNGIQVVGNSIDTPNGTIFSLGPDCADELQEGAVIYFSEENFFSKFEHRNITLWYIDEPSILVYEPV
ncbi:hypothetical protein E4H12_10250 [Candidatus Thorarchaeota archaeon]|nr:MAG: hypothetical protein E4H12_10250 [Candidatus Thorarchaeota archaeon]